MEYINFEYFIKNLDNANLFSDPLVKGLLHGLTLGVKSCIMIFVFI